MKTRLLLMLLLAATCIASQPSQAQIYTLWHSPRPAASSDPEISFAASSPSTALNVFASAPGTYTIGIPLSLPSNVEIDHVSVCYDLELSRTYIDEIRIVELTTPGSTALRLVDSTDLTNDIGECHNTTVMTTPHPYSPSGTLTLELVLVYADSADQIELGGIGVHLLPVAATSPLP